MRRIIFGIMILVLLFAGCLGNKEKEETGKLVIKITDKPTDLNVESLVITIDSIEAHKESSSNPAIDAYDEFATWIKMDGEKTFDLIKIKDVKELLASADLEPGKYTRIILGIKNATAIINGEEVELEVPSEEIKLVHEFEIKPNQNTTLILDFDAQESIVESGKSGKYILKPTIKVIQEE